MQTQSNPQTVQRPAPDRQAERSQVDIAQEALAIKREAEKTTPHFEEFARDTARTGMTALPNEDQPPSGAFDHAGQLPAMQRSKFARR